MVLTARIVAHTPMALTRATTTAVLLAVLVLLISSQLTVARKVISYWPKPEDYYAPHPEKVLLHTECGAGGRAMDVVLNHHSESFDEIRDYITNIVNVSNVKHITGGDICLYLFHKGHMDMTSLKKATEGWPVKGVNLFRMPNRGRESHSYLLYILMKYNTSMPR